MAKEYSRQEVFSFLSQSDVATVATASGEEMRTRMMHFAVDEAFTIYLATMKGDPKTLQMTHHPSVSLLVHRSQEDINLSREAEISGAPQLIRDEGEREKALRLTYQKSPVVKYLVDSGNAQVLDCIKVVPRWAKYRVFGDIVQGMPPTVIEFPENRQVVSDWGLLKKKLVLLLRETRAPFLTASAVPVLLGTAIAWAYLGSLNWVLFLLALIAGVLLHAGTNIINDYFDHLSRNDELNREFVRPFSGGSRLIQLGLLSPLEVLTESLVCFGLGSLIGLYLAWVVGPWVLALGAFAILSGFFYTGRPFNWASRGAGEALVGLNFGPLMVLGAYYVQTQSFSWIPLVASLPVGLLIAAVLYINEFPDYAADKAVGKKTWVVRAGRERAVFVYAATMGMVYLLLLAGVVAGMLPLAALLMAITLPLVARAITYTRKYYHSSFDLAPANALTVTSHLAVGLVLTWVYVWQAVGGNLLYGVAIGLAFSGFVAYMYWHVEKQKKVFHGLKAAVGGDEG
jgi:1,4-dihydroxy-2-naphthoate octaprenyltransferase